MTNRNLGKTIHECMSGNRVTNFFCKCGKRGLRILINYKFGFVNLLIQKDFPLHPNHMQIANHFEKIKIVIRHDSLTLRNSIGK